MSLMSCLLPITQTSVIKLPQEIRFSLICVCLTLIKATLRRPNKKKETTKITFTMGNHFIKRGKPILLEYLREGVKKKLVEFSTKDRTSPTHPPQWKKKTKNVLYVMKRILYDMGHLTVAKWLLQRALKFTQRVWFLKFQAEGRKLP